METWGSGQLGDALHALSQGMLVPTMAVLLALVVFAVYEVASLIVEIAVERRHYAASVPQSIEAIHGCAANEIEGIVQESGLVASQRKSLLELVSYLHLPEEPLSDIAKRLMGDITLAYRKKVERSDIAAKVAPMLGLMGTLIPLGPGILALGQGDTALLASSLSIAFDTTVAGLVVGVVCYIIARLRNRWYADYLVSMEALVNALLDKAALLRAADDTAEVQGGADHVS